MDHRTGLKRAIKKRRALRRRWIAVGLAILLLGGGLGTALWLMGGNGEKMLGALHRFRNGIAHGLFGEKPHFYELLVEKNGEDYRLGERDALVVSFRDEFVIKAVKTDVLFGGGITVDAEGLGGTNDLGLLLKGIDLVDRAVLSDRDSGGSPRTSKDYIRIAYRGAPIGAVPMLIQITPQDWLRYARSTGNQKIQIEYLKRAIRMNPMDINVRRMLAATYLRIGLTAEAIDEYLKILDLKTNDPATLGDLAKAYLKTERNAEAIKILERIVRINPKDDNAMMDLAEARGRKGDWKKAIAVYEDALKLRPDNAVAAFKLGEAYEKTKQYAKAARQYRFVLEKVPKADHVAVALADLALRMGNNDEAIRWHKEVLKRQPKNAAASANLGVAYGNRGMIKEEIESYRRAIALNPRDPVVHFNLAVAYEKNKDDSAAILQYQKVLTLKPNDGDALQRLADLQFKTKRFSDAVPLYERLLRQSDRKAEIYTRLGYAYAELKKFPAAADHFQAALRSGAKDPLIHQNLATVFSQMGKTKEALALYEKLAVGQPTEPVWNVLAESYLKEKQWDKALRAYRKLVDLNPKKASYYAGIAYVYGVKGDLDRQIEYSLESLKRDPEDDQTYAGLGEAYEKKGLYAEALKAYTASYRLNPDDARIARKIPQMKIRIIQKKHGT